MGLERCCHLHCDCYGNPPIFTCPLGCSRRWPWVYISPFGAGLAVDFVCFLLLVFELPELLKLEHLELEPMVLLKMLRRPVHDCVETSRLNSLLSGKG